MSVQTPQRSGTETIAAQRAIRSLRRTFAGPVHRPGDAPYDEQRRAFGVADARPSVIAEARTADDVRAALVAAREHDLPFAVQSTGHGTLVSSDDGVLLKTSAMTHVRVDARRRVATVGPGARWSDVIAAAQPYGLAPLSGDNPSVGVVGYTLGGGVGWLARRYGFAADSLHSVDLVTADGRMRTASREHDPDLFWAIRGGSGNFGVVTSMDIELFEVNRVFGGTAYFPLDRASQVLRTFADHAWSLPAELTMSVVLMRRFPADDSGGPVLALRGVYTGDAADARRAMRPVWDAAGEPFADGFAPMSYPETRTIGGTPPRGFELYEDLSDDLIHTMVDSVKRSGSSANALEVRHGGGAMAEPADPSPGPVGHRDVPLSIKIDAPGSVITELRASATGGSFLNFLNDTGRTAAAYTPQNYRMLGLLKATYDPDNFLHLNHNIPPVA